MNIELFKINFVKEKDISQIKEWINNFFPYTNFSDETILEKINNKNFVLLKHHQKNILTSFVEVEFLENKARLNALFVDDAWRGQGIGTKLLHRIVHECKRKRFHELFLLVKESNDDAKLFYGKLGFEFNKMHNKKIDGSKVEVWNMEIP